jgi:hypothetical protein
MALINLKTNLLTLKYGGDKLKGGSSNQPYITTPIPGLQSGYDPNTGQIGYSIGAEDNPPFDVLAARFPDALVRGGLLAPINAGKDVSRLTQYFFDLKSPRGLIFIANQNLLSRTAVKTEASYGAGYGGGALNEGIYLPTSTLAQVAVQGWTGTHLNKQGLNPLKPTGAFTGDSTLEDILGAGGINTYSEVMKEKKQNDIDNITSTSGISNKYYNRLLQLHRVKIENQPLIPVRKRDRIPIDTNTDVSSPILSYGGGPNSILGVNNTNIRFASERTGINNSKLKLNSSEKEKIQKQLNSFSSPHKGSKEDNNIKDFRKSTPNSPNTSSYVLKRDLNTNGIGYGNPSINNPNKTYLSGSGFALDKINAEEINTINNDKYQPNNTPNDLVDFNIMVFDNTASAATKKFLRFRAYIKTFSDSFTPKWNSINYVGRGNTLYNYEGFTRDIRMDFTVAVQSYPELDPIYKKLNYLASTTTPDYTDGGFMRGNLHQLKIGNYLNNTSGIITSLSYTVNMDGGWEIEKDKQLPYIIDVSLGFTPIQNFLPRRGELNFIGSYDTFP